MGKYVRGLDYMELEGGGRGSGGGGGMGSKALNAAGIASGVGLASVPLTFAHKMGELQKERKEKREADAEIKRETRGVEKTSNDRAREAQEESTRQNKTDKAYEDARKNMAKGGTASARADGIAQRGKTRGIMVACGGGMMKK
jgi:hypothetical protein